MDMLATEVGWPGVVAGAVVAFIVGWAWYSPILFGKGWAAGNNVELGSAQSMPVAAMVMQAVGLLLIAWLIGVLMASGAGWLVALATIAFLAFNISNALFIKKNGYVIAVDAGYLVVCVAVMATVQALI